MTLKQFYTGNAIGFIAVLAIALCAFAVWKLHTPAPLPLNPGWKIYDNKDIGLYFEYEPTFTLNERVIKEDGYVETSVDDPAGDRYAFTRSYSRQSDIDGVRDFFTGPYPKQVSISNISPLQTAVERRLYGMQGVEVYGRGAEGHGFNDQFFYLHGGRLWVIALDPVIEGHATPDDIEPGTPAPTEFYKEIYQRILASIRIAPVAAITSDSALAQLQADLAKTTPHFIASSTANTLDITPDERTISIDVSMLLEAQYAEAYPNNPPFNFVPGTDFWLNAIGARYILVAQAGADKFSEAILDSQTGQMTPISGNVALYLAPGRNIALYIGPQSIYSYSLNQASVTLVAGSQLSGTETYHDGVGGLGIIVEPHETHTNNSITISTFDSSKSVSNPDGGTMYAKVGQKTLGF